MSVLAGWISQLTQWRVGGAPLAALASICFAHYLLVVLRRLADRQQAEQLRHEADVLEEEVRLISRERSLARLENVILQEILRQPDVRKALELLLRRFIPNLQDAFAAFFSLDSSVMTLADARGLSDESLGTIAFDTASLTLLNVQRVIRLRDDALRRHPFFRQLSPADRSKAKELYLLGIGDGEQLTSVLVTTQLIPAAAIYEERLELTQRLAGGISGSVRLSLALQRESLQLRSTRDMLELRAIADNTVEPAPLLTEKFLARLAQVTRCERAAWYMIGKETGSRPRPYVRSGVQLPPHLQGVWNEHEQKLALLATSQLTPACYNRQALARNGIETLVRSAILAPLIKDDRLHGLLILTRQQDAEADPLHRELASWAASTIGETLSRVVNLATIERQAREDALTGLANRRTFDQQLQAEIEAVASARQVESSLILIDLDHFKSINDEYGHQAGDEVLRETARILRDEVGKLRAEDRPLLARYGGEELALTLPAVGINGAKRIAESLRTALARHEFEFQGRKIPVTASFGVATCPLHAKRGDELLAAADAALYLAKQSGRNCVRLPESESALAGSR